MYWQEKILKSEYFAEYQRMESLSVKLCLLVGRAEGEFLIKKWLSKAQETGFNNTEFVTMKIKERLMFKVYDSQCGNCLLSKDRIVSTDRVKDILQEVRKNNSYFICHKSSINGGNICCSKFFKDLRSLSQLATIAHRLGAVEYIPQKDNAKLVPYRKTFKPKKIMKTIEVEVFFTSEKNITKIIVLGNTLTPVKTQQFLMNKPKARIGDYGLRWESHLIGSSSAKIKCSEDHADDMIECLLTSEEWELIKN